VLAWRLYAPLAVHRIVEVPGLHMVQWDAFDEVATAVEQLLSSATD